MSAKTTPANCLQYELEINIAGTRQRVWQAIFEETNFWWLPDFHQMGGESVVTFDPTPGGKGLVETTDDGGGLLWYSVQMHLPRDFKIYLTGHLAPEWGGPATSLMSIALEEVDGGCLLKISDSFHGNVSEKTIESTSAGWTQLFTEGLKGLVENGTRRDNG